MKRLGVILVLSLVAVLAAPPHAWGEWRPAERTEFGAGKNPCFVATGLLDDDSHPDLVVERIVATSNNAQVVINNKSIAPVLSIVAFRVDLYVNPNPVPTGVNQIWNDLADEGLVWGVTVDVQAGGVITLTIGDEYYWPTFSNLTGALAEGTPVYAQADSASTDTTYGAVLENHEITGGEYNNVSGPVLSTATFGATGDRRLFDRLGMRPTRHGNLPRRH